MVNSSVQYKKERYSLIQIKILRTCNRKVLWLNAISNYPSQHYHLLISLLHPILELILITPIRYSTQHFFPLFSKFLPTQEPVTPPLPRTFPSVRILITEH
ncbi:hypothetical protein Mgra_00005195 [Meloidogyne graminicola]|uniref:Uncharacterized protein n=1 Tax=Meloidogyne graminicola TaxID=189291 RepID=A0A8S9ZQ32_9BILA|nr:hypothetical protein Mgra_00005195 [Meloidogyne graminicola]